LKTVIAFRGFSCRDLKLLAVWALILRLACASSHRGHASISFPEPARGGARGPGRAACPNSASASRTPKWMLPGAETIPPDRVDCPPNRSPGDIAGGSFAPLRTAFNVDPSRTADARPPSPWMSTWSARNQGGPQASPGSSLGGQEIQPCSELAAKMPNGFSRSRARIRRRHGTSPRRGVPMGRSRALCAEAESGAQTRVGSAGPTCALDWCPTPRRACRHGSPGFPPNVPLAVEKPRTTPVDHPALRRDRAQAKAANFPHAKRAAASRADTHPPAQREPVRPDPAWTRRHHRLSFDLPVLSLRGGASLGRRHSRAFAEWPCGR